MNFLCLSSDLCTSSRKMHSKHFQNFKFLLSKRLSWKRSKTSYTGWLKLNKKFQIKKTNLMLTIHSHSTFLKTHGKTGFFPHCMYFYDTHYRQGTRYYSFNLSILHYKLCHVRTSTLQTATAC